MKVLIGTTNPSKVKRFEELLAGYDIEFYTLKDIGVTTEPEESGNTPIENSIIKAKFYGQYFDRVICNDSGLYFDELPLDDPRQPGLNIRTPNGGKRLDDEEMITYYANLVHELGGKVLAYYMDGVAVYNQGEVFSFIEDSEATRLSAFYMVDKPSDKRHPGWPIDSISLNRSTMTYFVDAGNHKYDNKDSNFVEESAKKENIILGEYRARTIAFLKQALGINRELISKTEGFLRETFDNSEFLNTHPSDKEYRLQHSYRVANIGKKIAQAEGFDVTETIIACLLHDISYCETFVDFEKDWKNHGRSAARIVRPFLESLGLAPERINDICYGIAIHVDDEADFEWERTPFAETVGDADNIDRFDVYRVYEHLQYCKFSEMSFVEKQEKVDSMLLRLHELKDMKLGTKTAQDIWLERIAYYIGFYEKLRDQLANSARIV